MSSFPKPSKKSEFLGSPSRTVTVFPPRAFVLKPQLDDDLRRNLLFLLRGALALVRRPAARRADAARGGGVNEADGVAPVHAGIMLRRVVADPISAPPGVFVPPAAVEVHAVRSGGPGGQNVNKVASKILLEVDLSKVEGLDALARRRLATLAGRRLGADGILRITAQESRDRFRNLESARGTGAASSSRRRSMRRRPAARRGLRGPRRRSA